MPRACVPGSMRLELALLLTVGCAGDTLSLGSGRNPLLDASTLDANADAGTPYASFSEPAALALGEGNKDDDPSLTRDLSLLYFNSQREGGAGREDIWWSTRNGAGWDLPRPVSELNTERRETGIAISGDGLRIWFSSDREGGAGGLDVYVAERATREAAFGPPQRIQTLSSLADDLVSATDPSERTLYLARRDGEDDDYDLYVARRGDGDWSAPQPISELNSDDEESDAFPVSEGLLFTRDGDLFLAAGGDGSYRDPQRMPALNSEKDDRDPWASDDLKLVIFSSNRTGSYLLYESRR